MKRESTATFQQGKGTCEEYHNLGKESYHRVERRDWDGVAGRGQSGEPDWTLSLGSRI